MFPERLAAVARGGYLANVAGRFLVNLAKFGHHALKSFIPAYCFTWFTRKGEGG